jgi:hypothetical protein
MKSLTGSGLRLTLMRFCTPQGLSFTVSNRRRFDEKKALRHNKVFNAFALSWGDVIQAKLSPSIHKFTNEFIPSGLSAEGASSPIMDEKYVSAIANRRTRLGGSRWH